MSNQGKDLDSGGGVRSPRHRRRWVALSVLSVTALALASCASDSSDSASGGSDADCGNVLKVGVAVPLTGELGSFGQDWQDGATLAVEQINESGALPDGWTMELVAGDEKGDAEEGLRVVQKMIDTDNVSYVVGPTSSSVVAMIELAASSQTPIISPSAGTVSLDELGGDFVYRVVSSDSTQGVAVNKWFTDQGITTIGMMVQNEEATTSPARVLKGLFEGSGGTVVAETEFNPGQPSYSAELQSVVSANPEMIFVATGQESGVTILKELFQAGYEGRVLLTSETTVQEFIDAVGAADMEGVEGMTPQADTSTPEYQAFATAYEARFGAEPELFTANMYDGVVLGALAAVAANSTCGAAINANLTEVATPDGEQVTTFAAGATALKDGNSIDYTGASGPVDLDETGSVADSYAILQVVNGEWEEIEFYSADQIAEAAAG